MKAHSNFHYSTSFFFLDIVFSLSKKNERQERVFYPAEMGPGLMCSTCLHLTWGLSIGGNGSELKTSIRKAFKISSLTVLAEKGA